MAWGAVVWARRAPTDRHTYGWRRSSVLAALGNAVFLLVSIGIIFWEALRRLQQPAGVDSHIIIWVSAAGIVVNTATALMFMAGRKGDLNVRAAFMHMAADAIISAGVVVAGIVITYTGWVWLDPAVSMVLAVVILAGTWGLLRDSLALSLDAVPAEIDAAGVRNYLQALPEVAGVHHLHIWGLSTSETALTAHLVLKTSVVNNELLTTIDHDLAENFQIGHATIQFEAPGECPCTAHECGRSNP